MFTILKAKAHHHNTHYDVALTHQHLQWFWFLSQESGSSEREREIIINDRLKGSAQNHNPFSNNHGQRLFA